MKVVIMAGGIGNRLLPHSEELPKCLLEINGKSILQYQLEALHLNNLKDVIIVIGYKGEKIKEFLLRKEFSDFNFEIIENKDYKNTNSSYGLWLVKDFIKEGFIYLNSDLIFHPNLLKKLLEDKSSSSIIIDKDIKINDDMFKVKLEQDLIKAINKKIPLNEAHGKAIGPAKFDIYHASKLIKKLDEIISKGEKNKWVYTIFNEFAQENTFAAINNDGLYWGEVDELNDLKRIEAILKNL